MPSGFRVVGKMLSGRIRTSLTRITFGQVCYLNFRGWRKKYSRIASFWEFLAMNASEIFWEITWGNREFSRAFDSADAELQSVRRIDRFKFKRWNEVLGLITPWVENCGCQFVALPDYAVNPSLVGSFRGNESSTARQTPKLGREIGGAAKLAITALCISSRCLSTGRGFYLTGAADNYRRFQFPDVI